jgi:hypothetical protein
MGKKKYKGALTGFPHEVVEKMLDHQEAQGNPRSVNVLEQLLGHSCIITPRSAGGFTCASTVEGYDFWLEVICKKDFARFFARYPKTSDLSHDLVGEKVLITLEEWFTAPDGKQYQAVHGKLLAVRKTEDAPGFNPSRVRANWLYQFEGMAVMGHQVGHVIAAEEVNTGDATYSIGQPLHEYPKPGEPKAARLSVEEVEAELAKETARIARFIAWQKGGYKGALKGFPFEVVEKMLDNQEAQGNPRDVKVFEEIKSAGKGMKGFEWKAAPEQVGSPNFWAEVIVRREFGLFFDKYPERLTLTPNK